jgi:hypothetical protein
MRGFMLSFAVSFYRLLLRAYPVAFQDRFGEEMNQVYRTLSEDALHLQGIPGLLNLSGSVIADWLQAVVVQWYLFLSKRKAGMMLGFLDQKDNVQPLSGRKSLLAALPFVIFGVCIVMDKLHFSVVSPAPDLFWQTLLLNPFLISTIIVFLGFGAALLAGFPRWGYTYLGWSIFYAWWWMNIRINRHSFEWVSLLPLVVMAAGLLIRHSFKPLRTMLSGIWQDWTLPSLGIYIFFSFAYMIYDENHHPLLLVFISFATIVTFLGAWGYFYSGSPIRRTASLVCGMLLAAAAGFLSYATWDYHAYYGIPKPENEAIFPAEFIIPGVVVIIFIGGALLSLWRAKRNARLSNI